MSFPIPPGMTVEEALRVMNPSPSPAPAPEVRDPEAREPRGRRARKTAAEAES